MAYSATAGERKTKVRIKGLTRTINSNGYPVETWSDLFPAPIWCKWVNAHGQESAEAMKLGAKELATITMLFSDKVNPECEVYRESDPMPYEVVSFNDVEDAHKFLEIKVKRKVQK